LAVVLGAVSIIDQSRHAYDWRDMLNPAFIATMTVLMTIALAGLWLTVKLLKWRKSLLKDPRSTDWLSPWRAGPCLQTPCTSTTRAHSFRLF
jgi:uncharacterized membrane protein